MRLPNYIVLRLFPDTLQVFLVIKTLALCLCETVHVFLYELIKSNLIQAVFIYLFLLNLFKIMLIMSLRENDIFSADLIWCRYNLVKKKFFQFVAN